VQKKNLVVMGAGLIGKRHIDMISDHPDCHLVAVIEPQPALHTSKDINYVTSIDEIDDALASTVDGVVIATPTGLHYDHAIAAADRNWHILIEKPVCASPAEAAALARYLEGRNLVCLVGHHRRYHDSISVLKQAVHDGTIGQPLGSSLIWSVRKPDDYFANNWRQSDGSPVMINLIHDVDLMRFVLGDIAEITGFGAADTRAQGRVETGALALRFSSGLCGTVMFSDAAPSPWGFESGTAENPNIAASHQDMWWITGTRASISFPSLTLWSGSDSWGQAQSPSTLPSQPTIPLHAQLDHFISAMSAQATPMITVADAAHSLEAAFQIEKMLSGQIG
jgi:predicted dehydrogenase